MKETPERIQLLLKQVVDHFSEEDKAVRESQIRTWRKLKYYWNGFQQIYYSETAHDWRVPPSQSAVDASYYDKPINVFRAYLESIIAALSISVPSIVCLPDDADNALDLATAKAGDKIAELIYKHNDVILLWLHALYIYCTEGMIACYNYTKEDYKFGSYSENTYEDGEQEVDVHSCPLCGGEIPKEFKDILRDEFDPGQEDVELHDLLLNSEGFCANCFQEVAPVITQKKIAVSRLVGVTTKPKSRQCLEVYGGLYVKIPNYACKQSDIPYLIFSYETHYSNAIDRYPILRDKFSKKSKISGGGNYDSYEQWGRLSTQYLGEYPSDNATIRHCWLRPSAFNVLNDEADVKELKKLYPDGVNVTLVNDLFAEAENENLDDHWTLTHNPLSDYLHHDPLGMLLTSVQEITNDLVSLVIQTIEHGIPQTFADPTVLNFDAYRQAEVAPGSIYPAKPKTGKGMGEAFYEVKTASLSAEVLPFADKTQEMGQLVSGALPAIFGQMTSKTASQDTMSKAQALQRLQSTWKMLTIWWKNIFGKVIPAYIKEVKDDERNVVKDTSGNWINIYIRKAELEGKIGNIELEASEQLPVTWAQKKDVIMQLMQAGNPLVMQALSSPENIQLITQAIGLSDFVIPGADDRDKQYEEIKQLLNSEPIQSVDEMTGQPIEQPSVDVDPTLDNHALESEICRSWLVGPAGRLAKVENEVGYRNVLLHMQRHVMIQQQNMMQQSMPEEQGKPMAAKLPQGASNAQI